MPANLYKRDGIWYARAKIRGGDYRRSLQTGSLAEARERLKKFLQEASHVRYHGEERHSWKGAVADWNERARNIGASTIKRYLVSLAQMEPHLGDLYVDEIEPKTIARIVAARAKHGVSNATIQRDLTAVSAVLTFCVAQGWIETNAARVWDRRSVGERRDPIVLPEPDWIDAVARRAGATIKGNFAALIRFAQYTGFRQEEVASLRRDQVKPHGVELHRTKANRVRVVDLDDRARGTFGGTVQYLKEPYVFWHRRGKRYANVSAMFARVVKACVAAGEIPQAFRFHDLRHWYAVDFLRAGRGTVYDLQPRLGHTSVKTTEWYLRYLTPDEARAAMSQKVAQ